jgi:hypothetical protein
MWGIEMGPSGRRGKLVFRRLAPLLPPNALVAVLIISGCATTPTGPAQPEAVRSHVYPLPLDNVLAQATPLLAQRGWQVHRAGDNLVTNWVGGETDALVSYRIVGERIDAAFCSIRVERLVATPARFYLDHPITYDPVTGQAPFQLPKEFLGDSANDARATGIPNGMVLTQLQRDKALEVEFEGKIDPVVAALPKPAEEPSAAPKATEVETAALPSPQTAEAQPQPEKESGNSVATKGRASRHPASLAGVWDGTFTFRGNLTGSFNGEVTIAVDGETVDIDDFCPKNGGTLSVRGSKDSAVWQGKMTCPGIAVEGCPSASLTYETVNASLKESTLTLVGAGTVNTDPRCSGSSGVLSVAFIAQKADYIHIAVTRVKRATACVWPSDWEDFASTGSMAMPDSDSSYLGIIRAKGIRLAEIQRLLRHCRQTVLLHGVPVLMKLAVTRPHGEMQ